jgi:hypothetical protein
MSWHLVRAQCCVTIWWKAPEKGEERAGKGKERTHVLLPGTYSSDNYCSPAMTRLIH